MKKILMLTGLAGLAYVEAQFADISDVFQPLPEPLVAWQSQIEASESSGSAAVLLGNGVYLTPDETKVIATSVGGTLTAFDAFSGSFLWDYDPPTANGGIVSCHSGVTFADVDGDPYIVYSIIDDERSVDVFTRVVAVSTDGMELWVSPQLEGQALGTPVASEAGDYVFLTHNAEGATIGHFSILEAAMAGEVFFSMSNVTNAFGPLGIFHSPAEGYYDGGAGNTNDIVVWSYTPKPGDTEVGDGATFAFQFPVGFPEVAPESFTLLGARPFQTITPPVLTNQGRSLYFSTSRSAYFCWVGEEGFARYNFSQGPQENTGFPRGMPPYQAIWSTPALSSDPIEPFIFGGTAASMFVRLNHDFTADQRVQTTSPVQTQAIVAPGDAFVYYVELNGIVHRAAFNGLSDIWTYQVTDQVMGQFALRENGSFLYVSDVAGFVTALQVTQVPVTEMPSKSPTISPSDSPSTAPVLATEPPTAMTTPAPVASPTEAPVVAPISELPPPSDAPGVTDPATVSAGVSPRLWKFAIATAATIGFLGC